MRRSRDLSRLFDMGIVLYKKGRSLRDAAKEVGVSASGLRKYMARHSVDRRGPGNVTQLSNAEQRRIVSLHHEAKKSLREIAIETGYDRETVAKIIRRAGMKTFTAKQVMRLKQEARDQQMREEIVELARDGFPLGHIARVLHTNLARVRRVLSR